MAGFFDHQLLSQAIYDYKSIFWLAKKSNVVDSGQIFSKGLVHKLFHLLCQHGFTDSSLMPAYQNCGSPGEKRPFGEAKKGQNILRKKAGRKTIKERLVPGFVSPQAGMSAANTKLFISLYKQLKKPTLTDVKVYRKIITNVFVKNYEISKNGLVPVMPEIGSYPNYRQFQHLINSMNKIDKLLLDTTKGHFNRNHRGLTSKSWMNVAGPGHVFAIDSTIADIYLRSSANRAWICGRPIVYIVVDVWSSAIVGFYVCWTGPAWNMAKVALFCTVAPKDMVANLWGIEEKILLSPEPTLPYSFRTDRGEYLSLAATQTALNTMFGMEYNPSYRPDLKGIVEVLNRITKDEQYGFIPGAIDARMKELELRTFNPDEAMLVLKEYVEYLTIIFNKYNHTANLVERLDADMMADDLTPTPAALWAWGYENGLGYSKDVSSDKLVKELLPRSPAVINRSGFHFTKIQYESNQVDLTALSAQARNFGAIKSDIYYFPGSVSNIWWDHPSSGLIDLTISPMAKSKPDFSQDEWLDLLMYSKIKSPQREHDKLSENIVAISKSEKIIISAKAATQQAILDQELNSTIPSKTEVKKIEQSFETVTTNHDIATGIFKTEVFDPEMDEYTKMMSGIINSVTEGLNDE